MNIMLKKMKSLIKALKNNKLIKISDETILLSSSGFIIHFQNFFLYY